VSGVRAKLLAAFCLAIAILTPASASATTVRLGPALPDSSSAFLGCGVKGSTCVALTALQQTLPDPGVTLAAPADGTVTSWSVLGLGTLKLRVLRPVGGSVISEGTSAAASELHGASNATNLQIRAGDVIAVDLIAPSSLGLINQSVATASTFTPPVPEDALADASSDTFNGNELLFNATVTLAPSVGGLLPASGRSTGGESIKIVGSNLDGATGVQFGSKPAIFAVDSPNQITATAPAVPASTVDVRVTGPGGTSAISAGDKYTFTTTPGGPGSGPNLISPLTAGQPKLTALAQSASKWRRGHQQAKISRAPVGTTFSFNLSKPATVKLAFTQKASGRKVRGACRAPNPSNASKRRCVRTIVAGTLNLPGHAGLNKLRFQGLLASGKSLKLGSYNVSLTARDAGGLQSAAHSLSFTIVG
jgi:hypothetical protein